MCWVVVVSYSVVAMSRTPVAIDCVVWFSLADRAGAVDRSIRVSERAFSGWVVEPIFESYGAARDFAARAGAGCVVGGVSLLFVGASLIQSRGHARCLALLLVLSCH
jgi:hypothetical protein